MADAASEGKASSGSPMIKIIIIVVLILVAGGGGFVGWTLLNKGEDSTKEAAEEAPPPQFNVNATPVTYNLDTYIVNLMGKSGMSKKYLKVGIILGVGSEEQKAGNRSVQALDK